MNSEFPEQTQSEEDAHPIVAKVTALQGRLSRMESLIQQAAALAFEQARRADEIQATMEATVPASEAQPQETEGDLDQKGTGREVAEQELKFRIQELEGELREKQGLVEAQSGELGDLRSKLEEASALAAAQAEQTMEMQRGFEATAATLKSQLAESEASLSQKDTAMKEMEESLTGLEESLVNQIRILEGQLEEMVQKSDTETPEPAKKRSASRKPSKQG